MSTCYVYVLRLRSVLLKLPTENTCCVGGSFEVPFQPRGGVEAPERLGDGLREADDARGGTHPAGREDLTAGKRGTLCACVRVCACVCVCVCVSE